MKITKYEHSCLVIEDNGRSLVVDPGDFSVSLPARNDVVAIVITHVHFDHFNKGSVETILAANPEAKIFSVQAVKEQIPATEVCKPGDTKQVDPFNLEFFGGQHAIIHEDYPKFENVGILINESFYYGGDSLDEPNKPVAVLAVPISGPWAKTGEELDYMAGISPKLAFATHDWLNGEAGNASQDRWFTMHAKKRNIEYRHFAVGESIEF